MKIRNGFVSNSSSSSFLIGSNKELSKEDIKAILMGRKDVFEKIVDEAIDFIATELSNQNPIRTSDYIEDYGSVTPFAKKCVDNCCAFIYQSFFSNESHAFEAFICENVEMYHAESGLVIEKEAGY